MSDVRVLFLLLIFFFVVLMVLLCVYIVRRVRQNNQKYNDNEIINSDSEKKEAATKGYKIKSVFDFMDFEGIEDNMIVQKKGKKYLMAIECQGINYDLMSEMEKTSVESGFIQFLNTLTSTIQIYIQTRTINLERSLVNYREKVKEIENNFINKQSEYNQMVKSGQYSQKELDDKRMEVIRQQNLYEYGKDIIKNTENMSLNKNILKKKYYIIVTYFYSSVDADEDLYSKSEIKDIAFSELYTKCQSMIRALSTTGVLGRIINSYELADLLYNAYNRDESETFGVNKAVSAEYDQLYVQTSDILERKMQAINNEIEKKALIQAEDAVSYARSEKAKEVKEKEESIESLIDKLAKNIVKENEQYLGEEITQIAMEKLEKYQKGKEEKKNVQKEEKTRRKNGKK